MKGFVEKLKKRLGEQKGNEEAYYMQEDKRLVRHWNNCVDNTINIINEYAEKYNDDWIPCSERLPETGKRYLVSCIVKTGDIEEHTVWHAIYAGARGWYTVESKALNTEVEIEVVAWQSLPQSYQPKQQESEWKDKVMKHFTNVE